MRGAWGSLSLMYTLWSTVNQQPNHIYFPSLFTSSSCSHLLLHHRKGMCVGIGVKEDVSERVKTETL